MKKGSNLVLQLRKEKKVKRTCKKLLTNSKAIYIIKIKIVTNSHRLLVTNKDTIVLYVIAKLLKKGKKRKNN